MRLIILLTLVAAALALPAVKKCNGTIIRNLFFEEEVLKDGLDAPFQLAVDWSTNTLVFTVTPGSDGEIKSLSTAYINLDTKEFNMIPDLKAGIAVAIDNKNHVIYLNGEKGIYTFNATTKLLSNYDEHLANICQMFFKDRLYYTMFGDNAVYVYENGKSEKLKSFEVTNTETPFVGVDKNDNVWFSNENGLFYYHKGEKVIRRGGDYHVVGFTTDVEGNLLFATSDGVYFIKEDRSIERLFEKELILGVAVDSNNNIIYSDQHKVIRLNPVECQL